MKMVKYIFVYLVCMLTCIVAYGTYGMTEAEKQTRIMGLVASISGCSDSIALQEEKKRELEARLSRLNDAEGDEVAEVFELVRDIKGRERELEYYRMLVAEDEAKIAQLRGD